jgi:hypothetical protein
MIIAIKMEVIAVAPAFDCVAFSKISMNGYPVGVLKALSTSPMQNKMARIMAKLSAPLRNMVKNMLRGTLIDASLTSSANLYQSLIGQLDLNTYPYDMLHRNLQRDQLNYYSQDTIHTDKENRACRQAYKP